jgi:hypothetical protein
MEEHNNGVNVFNPDKRISEEITLNNLVAHNLAMDLARRGIPSTPSDKPLTFNDRMDLRYMGLLNMISAQQNMIASNNIAIVKINSINNWEKKYKSDEERLIHKFEEDDNDYNELRAILLFLDECEQKLIKAGKSRTYSDDFIWDKDKGNGEIVKELTPNFFKMMKDLEMSHESIYSILIYNKIVSNGISADEEITDKEIEEEQRRRIVGH